VIYPRPTEKTLSVAREAVEGTCPRCGDAALQRYPVLAETGWFDVVKCQSCLHSVSRERGPMLGPVQVYSSLLPDAVSS
jgi:transcription elongation factor Elf1